MQKINIGGDIRFIAKPFNELVEAVEKLQRMTGTNIRVSFPGGVPTLEYVGLKSGGQSRESSYTSPWAIIQKDATTVTVKAQDLANGYLCKSLIVAGLTTQEHATDADVTISASGVVYADITQSAGVYSVTFNNAATLPAQSSTHYYVALAYVTFNSAITALAQAQYGQINIAGRVV